MLQSLEQLFRENGVQYSPLPHPPRFTAQEAAAVEHVPGREHAKVTIVKAGNRFLMTVLPAPKRVDFVKLASLLPEHEAHLPTEDEFRALFPGCEPGAMPPFGNLFGVEVLVDRSLEKDESIVFQAGTHSESVRMRYDDFKRLAKPKIADFSR
ncbi:MAG: aminoacyl-tRNA deacylase [Candidatus Binatia bacterium]